MLETQIGFSTKVLPFTNYLHVSQQKPDILSALWLKWDVRILIISANQHISVPISYTQAAHTHLYSTRWVYENNPMTICNYINKEALFQFKMKPYWSNRHVCLNVGSMTWSTMSKQKKTKLNIRWLHMVGMWYISQFCLKEMTIF